MGWAYLVYLTQSSVCALIDSCRQVLVPSIVLGQVVVLANLFRAIVSCLIRQIISVPVSIMVVVRVPYTRSGLAGMVLYSVRDYIGLRNGRRLLGPWHKYNS